VWYPEKVKGKELKNIKEFFGSVSELNERIWKVKVESFPVEVRWLLGVLVRFC